MKIHITVCLLVTFIMTPAAAQEILFEDDFSAGISGAWIVPHGGWVVSYEELRNTTTCEELVCRPDIWAGGELQSDYMVSFDATLRQISPSPAGMALQVMIMFDQTCMYDECPEAWSRGYTAEIGYNSGAGIIRHDGPEAWGDIIAQRPHGDPRCSWIPGVVYHVYFGRRDGFLVVNKWPVGEPEPSTVLLGVADDSYNEGYWGITNWMGKIAIDNFKVVGFGQVPTEPLSWGSLKALYR